MGVKHGKLPDRASDSGPPEDNALDLLECGHCGYQYFDPDDFAPCPACGYSNDGCTHCETEECFANCKHREDNR